MDPQDFQHWRFDVRAATSQFCPCRVDVGLDGLLAEFDFLAFQNLFNLGDPRADFDGDGRLTLFDFLSFQNEFEAGCF